MSQQAVAITNKLYQTRSAAKLMLGPRYDEFAAGMADLIRDIMACSPRKDLTPLVVAKELAEAPGIGPHQAIMVLAAAVDMTESQESK